MHTFIRTVEAELGAFAARLFENLAIAHEHAEDLAGFGSTTEGEAPGRRQRHLEWFLLERPCEALGGVPLEHFFAGLPEDEGLALASVYAALRASRAGVFAVIRSLPGEGLLLEDLLGRGQYPVGDPALSEAVTAGDLIVGRLYPEELEVEGARTTWAPSSAAETVRSKQLLAALERDLESMRRKAKGPLRMSQRDLEEMFFSAAVIGSASREAAAGPRLEDARERARAVLAAAGLSAHRSAELLGLLDRSPLPEGDTPLGADDPLGWILSELAFESDVALDQAQAALSVYWHAAHAAPGGDDELAPGAAAAALARFDAGRMAGEDLDALFAELETSLGLAASAPETIETLAETEAVELAPDFPGVLSALVQEFLWDGARMAGEDLDAFAEAHRGLELFMQFGAFIGLADELEAKHVELFAGRWVWEAGRLQGGRYQASALLRSLRCLVAWLTEHHGSSLAPGVSGLLDALEPQADRLQAIGGGLPGQARPDDGIFEFVGFEAGRACWLERDGGALELDPVPALDDLASGDLVRGQAQAGRLLVEAVYPAQASPYLNATS